MQNVTYDALITTVVVILAVCGAINVIAATVKVFRDKHKPQADAIKAINDKLATDKARLDGHEKSLSGLKEGQKALCEGVVALLNHELHNGNGAEMQKASEEITQWMIRK